MIAGYEARDCLPTNRIMEEKKPRRPRISTGVGSTNESAELEQRFDKVTNSEDSQTAYQNRPYQNNYQRQGGYQQRYNNYPRQNSYNQRSFNSKAENEEQDENATNQNQGYNGDHRQGYQPRPRYNNYQQGGYQQHQSGYQPRQQGGYQQRPGGYQPRQQGGYQQRPGGYQPRQQGGYQQRPGGYQPRQQGNNYEGGYQPRQQNGYQQRPGGYQRQQGGFQPRQQGGFQPRQGGYQPRQQGGYQQRPNNRYGYQQRPNNNMKFTPRPRQIDYVLEDIDPTEEIRLNKYMANAGICSRREADEYITSGRVKVNGETVTELGTKIKRNDVVEFDEKVVTPERKCYVLLNKPKDCVTTSDDPNGRLTVLDIVKNACEERIYPVGRLDRNTTGVLLLTNDGDLASKLTHPKYVKKKIYHVWTDKDITEEDMQRIADGIELEDGEIHADAISYVSDTDRNQAGIEIHSGRNRIVRRIFEALGYRVTKLDRVYFAGLTKKNLPRGRWRYLTQEEVNFLRMGSFE